MDLGKGNHNPGVGGSSPSSVTNNLNKVINLTNFAGSRYTLYCFIKVFRLKRNKELLSFCLNLTRAILSSTLDVLSK